MARKIRGPLVMLKRDLADIAIRDLIRQLIREELVRAGLLQELNSPPKLKTPNSNRPSLKLVKPPGDP